MASARILVADDDEAMRTTVAFTLLDDGYIVDEVESGNEVLRRVAASHPDAPNAEPHDYDLVVMDIRMPGLSGLETARRLREMPSAPRVILMTAFPSPAVIDDAEALHVPLLSKPFALGELRRLAHDVMRSPL